MPDRSSRSTHSLSACGINCSEADRSTQMPDVPLSGCTSILIRTSPEIVHDLQRPSDVWSATLPLGLLQDRRSLGNHGWFRARLGLDCEWLFANCVRAVLLAKLVRH